MASTSSQDKAKQANEKQQSDHSAGAPQQLTAAERSAEDQASVKNAGESAKMDLGNAVAFGEHAPRQNYEVPQDELPDKDPLKGAPVGVNSDPVHGRDLGDYPVGSDNVNVESPGGPGIQSRGKV